jgi:hypothetical protein
MNQLLLIFNPFSRVLEEYIGQEHIGTSHSNSTKRKK